MHSARWVGIRTLLIALAAITAIACAPVAHAQSDDNTGNSGQNNPEGGQIDIFKSPEGAGNTPPGNNGGPGSEQCNRAPVCELLGVGETVNIQTGQTLEFAIRASSTCPDLTVTTSVLSMLPDGFTFSETLPFTGQPELPTEIGASWTPTADQTGVFVIEFRVNDSRGRDAQPCVLTINVRECVDTPTCEITPPGPFSVAVGQAVSFTVSTDSVCEAAVLTINGVGLPAGVTTDPVLPATGAPGEAVSVEVMWIPSADQVGDFVLPFEILDSGVPMGSCAANVEVVDPTCPDLPECSAEPSGPFVIAPGETVDFRVNASSACPDVLLTLVNISLPPGAELPEGNKITGTSADPPSLRLVWTPGASQTGEFSAVFIVRDSIGRMEECVFPITVEPCLDPPTLTITPPGPFSVSPGETVTFRVDGVSNCAFSSLALVPSGVPDGAAITPSPVLVGGPDEAVGLEFEWTPTDSDMGDFVVDFLLLDSNGTEATGSAAITVGAECYETEDNDTIDDADRIDLDCEYFSGKLSCELTPTCEPDTYMTLFNKAGATVLADDNGSPLGNGWASAVYAAIGAGLIDNGDGTRSLRLGVTGRPDGLDGDLNGFFQNAPHGQLGAFELVVTFLDGGGAVIGEPIRYRDEFVTGAEAFRVNFTAPAGATFAMAQIDNTVGDVERCGDVDFYELTGLVPLCDYDIVQVGGLSYDCEVTPVRLGWFDKRGDLISVSQIDGLYSVLRVVADTNGRAVVGVTGLPDEDFDGVGEAPKRPGATARAPVDCPEPLAGHGVRACYTLCILPVGLHEQVPSAGNPSDLNSDGAVDAADLSILLGVIAGN